MESLLSEPDLVAAEKARRVEYGEVRKGMASPGVDPDLAKRAELLRAPASVGTLNQLGSKT